MTTIALIANDQLLTVSEQPKLASGDQNSVVLQVDFDSDWDGYAKSAVFFTDKDQTVYEQVLFNGQCTIPHEPLVQAGVLYIGIRGVKTDELMVKTSTLVKYKIEEGAPSGTGIPVAPTADVYQQLLGLSEQTRQIAQSVRDDFEAGAIPALQEQNKKNGFKFWVGTNAEYEAQKDTMSGGMFCIITDDTTEADILTAIANLQTAIDELKGVDLGTVPIQVDPFQFTYFIGINYDEHGNVSQSVFFTKDNDISYDDLELDAIGHLTDYLDNMWKYRLHFYWGDGGYMLDTTVVDPQGDESAMSFTTILGFKTNLGARGQG